MFHITPLTSFLYINTQAKLLEFTAQLESTPYLALDSEFLRYETYYPQLCLLQIATDQIIAIVDPLAVKELDPLIACIYNPNILKILHSGRQDLEILYHLTQALPQTVFDTQIAAKVAGYPQQLGYASLVKVLLHIDIEKSETRADWTLRPLAENLLEYARQDVRYLAVLYQILEQKMSLNHQMESFWQESQSLTDPGSYSFDPEDSWKKIKNTRRLKPQHLSLLKRLAAWREQTAQALDRPRNWIIHDRELLLIAKRQPQSFNELQILVATPTSKKTIKTLGEELLRITRLEDHQSRSPE